VDEDLSGAESLKMYRDGGGSIRTQDWYTLMRSSYQAVEAADSIGMMRSDAPIPEMAYTTVDQAFSGKYKVKEEFFEYDPITGERERKVVGALSDETLSLDEWRNETGGSALQYGMDITSENVSRGRMWFERRMV